MNNSNTMLDIKHIKGNEILSSVPVVAYAIDGEKMIFCALFGAETGVDAAHAISYGKGHLHLSRERVKAKFIEGHFKWHKSSVESLNKACSFVISDELLMFLPDSNKTYVMDMNPSHRADMSPETIQLVGQRISEFCNVSFLPEWYEAVINEARKDLRSPLVHVVRCENCRVWGIVADGDKWAELVQKCLNENKIIIRRNANK